MWKLYIDEAEKRVLLLKGEKTVYSLTHNPDFNPLADIPILGSSNSAGNKDMMSKIWTKWGHNYLIV